MAEAHREATLTRRTSGSAAAKNTDRRQTGITQAEPVNGDRVMARSRAEVKTFSPNGITYRLPRKLVNTLVNQGLARWCSDKKNIFQMCPVKSEQGWIYEQLGIDKHPLVVQGGLTRTETQPATRFHYRPLLKF
jgi:hypothetical protein